jgi:hypothetical protein
MLSVFLLPKILILLEKYSVTISQKKLGRKTDDSAKTGRLGDLPPARTHRKRPSKGTHDSQSCESTGRIETDDK